MLFRSILLIITIILIDQWSKYAVFEFLSNQETHYVSVLPFFNLVKVYNSGVSFGLLNNLQYGQWILASLTSVITLCLFFWLIKCKTTLLSVALSLIIGGAIGNIIDRVRFGAVADFLDFYIGPYHWPAFNVADSVIFIGVALVCVDQLFFNPNKE